MLKMKLSLMAGLSAVALLSTANTATAGNGTYAGLSVGYAHNKMKIKYNGNQTNFLRKFNNFEGVAAGAHFGWERFCPSQLFTAAELGLDFVPTSEKKRETFANNRTVSRKIEKGFSMDLALKAGYAFSNFVPYVRLGLVGTNWTQKAFIQQTGVADIRGKKSKFLLGFAPGAGFQTKLGASRWTTGVEYKYVIYNKHTLNLSNGNSSKMKPRTHDVRARLSYGF